MPVDTPLTPAQVALAQQRDLKEGYVHRALVGFDQFVGTLLNVQNDQTISSATEIAAHKKVWYSVFAKGLNFGLDLLQHSHGQLAQVGDITRAQEVIAKDQAALAVEQKIGAWKVGGDETSSHESGTQA